MAKRSKNNNSLLTSVARTLGHAAGRLVRLTHEVTGDEKVVHPRVKAEVTPAEQRSDTLSSHRPAGAKSSTKATTRRTNKKAPSAMSGRAGKNVKKPPVATRQSRGTKKRKSKRSSI